MRIHLETVIREYENDCISRGHSAHTMSAYSIALRQFRQHTEGLEAASCELITPAVVRSFAAESMKLLSAGGAHARLRVVRSFLRWATEEGYFDKNPMERVPMPKLPQKVLDAVTPQDMKKLLKEAQKSTTPLKYQALLAVLYDTGLRVSELWSLEMRDVLPNQCFFVRDGKGGKDRVVPVSRLTLKAVQQYVKQERDTTSLPQLFVVNQHTPYSNVTVYKWLERLCRRAEVKRYGPHCFRRGFAVNYLRNGGDVFTLQRIMGHSTLAMTNRYAAMTTDDLQDVHRRASPFSAL